MSQVRKLELGGSTTSDLDKALNEELALYKLKGTDERLVRDALARSRDHSQANPDSFKIDPVAKRYTVSGSDDRAFEGSPDDVRSNWVTGELKIKNDQDAMSVASAIYSAASQKPKSADAPKERDKFGIGNIKDYIVNTKYGTPEAFASDFKMIKDDNQRKKIVLQGIEEYLDRYASDSELAKDKLDYKDLEAVKKLRAIVNSSDINTWDAVKTGSYPFKWNINEFLIDEGEQATWDAQNAQKAQATATQEADNTRKSWISRGININLTDGLLNAGYKRLVDEINLPGLSAEANKAMNEYIKSKQGLIAQDDQNRYFVFDRAAQAVDADGSLFDQFSPLYGKAWKNDIGTGLQLGTGKYTLPDAGEVGRGLTLPEYPGWIATGWSRDKKTNSINVDALGNRDYTKYITLKRPGQKDLTLIKNPDNTYTDNTGKVIPNLQIAGYKPEFNITPGEWVIPENFKKYISTPVTDEVKVTKTSNWAYNLLKGNELVKAKDKERIAGLIKQLKYVAQQSKNLQSQKDAYKALKELDELLVSQNIILKKGGILKAQLGTSLGRNAVPNAPSAYNTQVNTTPTTSRDISNLVKGSSTLDKVALGLNAGSLLPGFAGSASAIGALGVEAFQGATDEDGWTWKDTGNLALNVGLVGASFIGLGGLRGVVKGGKIANKIMKAADTTHDLAKASKYADKEIKTAYDIVNKFAREKGLINLADISKAAKGSKEIENALGVVVGFAEGVAKAPKLLPSLTGVGSKTLNILDGASKYAAYANAAYNLGGAKDAAAKIISGDLKDLSLDDVNSLTAVAFGTKVGWYHGKQKIAKKYGVTASGSTPKKLTAEIEGKKVEITDEAILKEFGSWNYRASSKEKSATKIKEAFVKEYNKGLGTDKQIKIEDVKDFSPSLTNATSGTDVIRNKYDLKKNLYLQEKGTKWAKKYKLAGEEADLPKVTKTTEKTTTTESTKSTDTPKVSKLTDNRKAKLQKLVELKNRETNKGKKLPEKPAKKTEVAAESKTEEINKTSSKLSENISKHLLKPKSSAAKLKADFEKEYEKLVKLEYSKTSNSKSSKKKIQSLREQQQKLHKEFLSNFTVKRAKGGVFKFQKGGSSNILKLDGFLNSLKGVEVNPTDVANLGMYASTVASNKYIGDQQRQAAAAGMYTMPTMSQNYMRIDKTNALEGEKQSAKILSQTKRIADSTSDIDKGNAIRLEGMSKSNDLTTKAQQFDLARTDKLRSLQLDNNAKINQFNMGVLGKNRAMAAEAFKNIHLINANQRNAQNAAFGNVTRAVEKNYNSNQLNKSLKDYNTLVNDPKLKLKGEEYAKLAGDEGRRAVDAEYQKMKEANTTGNLPPVEETQVYKTWKERVKAMEDEIELLMAPIRAKQSEVQSWQTRMYLKKGGSLTKQEKIEIENLKNSHKSRMKEMELAYKAILHNNEMLQKALIKVFK